VWIKSGVRSYFGSSVHCPPYGIAQGIELSEQHTLLVEVIHRFVGRPIFVEPEIRGDFLFDSCLGIQEDGLADKTMYHFGSRVCCIQ
jgi:hypothetical protein